MQFGHSRVLLALLGILVFTSISCERSKKNDPEAKTPILLSSPSLKSEAGTSTPTSIGAASAESERAARLDKRIESGKHSSKKVTTSTLVSKDALGDTQITDLSTPPQAVGLDLVSPKQIKRKSPRSAVVYGLPESPSPVRQESYGDGKK